MIDLKYTKADKKKRTGDYPEPAMTNSESYPWGLKVTLDQETLAKLGRAAKTFEIGEAFTASAKFKVVSVSQESDRSDVGLQITALDLSKPGKVAAAESKKTSGPGGKAVA